MQTAFWIAVGVLALIVLPAAGMLLYTMPIARMVYNEQLVRTSPEKWRRENSCPTDAEYSAMYDAAEAWGRRYEAETTEVSVQSCGLRLAGRFTDFGADKTALILCGRAEGCLYSYYYAEPYRRAGFNILVVDQRAHGESEGTYSGMGRLEADDMLAWMRFLTESCHTKRIVLHGVCIGAACAVYTASHPDCPAALAGIVTDGLYRSFHDVFLARFKTNGKPVFPVLYEIEYLIKKRTGIDIRRDGPYRAIRDVKVPVLMIHSREDVSSLPTNVPALFEACPAEKTLVWMEHGAHSHLRIVNTDRYDAAVTAFVEAL